jgi:hypothetical protein
MMLTNRVRRVALAAAMLATASGSLTYSAVAGEAVPPDVAIPRMTSEAPASVSTAPTVVADHPAGRAPHVSRRTVGDIPAPALSAYEHAARIVDSVASCGIDWSLLAAIGSIESDHGRFGDNALSPQGRSVPGIYGPALDGTAGVARVADTDGGVIDRDTVFDRAVGPMQFIPATWDLVKVDADHDRHQDPQDIDDAAMAAAVYLCAGGADLSTTSGMNKAVLLYNHSQAYADDVLAVQRSYVRSAGLVPGTDRSVYTPGSGFADYLRGRQAPLPPRTSAMPSRSPGSPSRSAGGANSPTRATPKATSEVPGRSSEKSADPAPQPPTKDPVRDVVTPVREARTFCQEQVSGAQLTALGGLGSCVEAFVRGGASAVTGLLASVGGIVTTLLGG